MSKFFSVEGPFISFLNKMGQIIILTVLWLICCLPVITFVSSSSAFYYGIIKTVRRDVGYPVREFWGAFKRNLADSIVIFVGLALWAYLLYINMNYINNGMDDQMHLILYIGSLAMIILTICFLIYLFPVMSRFAVSKKKWIKMSLQLMLMRLPYTLILLVSLAVVAWSIFFFLPIALLVVLPGVWCYLATFLIEPGLKLYMPKKEEGEEKEWYDE